VKFTGSSGRVDVTLDRIDGTARLIVRDDGCGIGPEDLPYVFDRFRQADSSSTRSHSGLGLGLAIAQHIVQAHGGEITARSEGLGRGTTLLIELPAKPLSMPPPPPLPSGHRVGDGPSIEGRRVLFIDDEPDTLEVTALALCAFGAEVRTATSVDAAMAVIASFLPDAIVSDVAMPQRDGYDLIRSLRSLGAPLSLVPAIALTAQARPDDVERALQAGFARHLAKPVDSEVLASVIATLVPR
ncbi:MAG: ATP-binding response regulator, partial [Polyangiaceae bacterium]